MLKIASLLLHQLLLLIQDTAPDNSAWAQSKMHPKLPEYSNFYTWASLYNAPGTDDCVHLTWKQPVLNLNGTLSKAKLSLLGLTFGAYSTLHDRAWTKKVTFKHLKNAKTQ